MKRKNFCIRKENNFAIPAVNVVGTDSVNAVLESAAKVNSPVIIQFSNGGAGFYAGKGLKLLMLLFLVELVVQTMCILWLKLMVFL